MTSPKQGAKAGRREKHLARQAALKERKVLRLKRAVIHAAMGKAAKLQRSKRKGTRDFEQNMESLGFVARSQGFERGRSLTGTDVLDKYEARP